MKTSQNGIDLIKQFEGLRLKAYLCQANKATIGYGHVQNVHLGDVITEEQANQFLQADIADVETQLLKALNADEIIVNQNQFDALVSFAFNLGVYTLVHGGRNAKVTDVGSIWKNLKAKRFQDAGDAFMLYTKVGGTTSAGLVRRRRAERKLFLEH